MRLRPVPRWRQPGAELLDQLLALPMLVLTLVFLVVLVLPVIYPGLPPGARQRAETVIGRRCAVSAQAQRPVTE